MDRVKTSVAVMAEQDRSRWDAFVEAHPQGTFFHLSAWRGLIEDVFRHKTWFLLAERAGDIAGVLPLAEVKSRLNKSMRWMVANQLPVMTPQLYVAGVKLCDEDTDLGLDFTLHHMLQRHAAGQLSADAPAPADAGTPALVPGSAAKPTAEPKARGKTKAPAKPKVERPTPALKAEPSKAEPSKAEPEPLPGVEELPPPSDDDDDGGAQ